MHVPPELRTLTNAAWRRGRKVGQLEGFIVGCLLCIAASIAAFW